MVSGGAPWAEPVVPNQRPYGATSRPKDGAFLHGQRAWFFAAGVKAYILNILF